MQLCYILILFILFSNIPKLTRLKNEKNIRWIILFTKAFEFALLKFLFLKMYASFIWSNDAH